MKAFATFLIIAMSVIIMSCQDQHIIDAHEPLFKVQNFKTKKYGFMDSSFTYVIPAIYEDAVDFHGGRGKVLQDGVWYFIDTHGKTMRYGDSINIVNGTTFFSDGLIWVRKKTQDESKWYYALMDTTGQVLVPFRETFCNEFQEGIGVCNSPTGRAEAFDRRGTKIFSSDTMYLYSFTNGRAMFLSSNTNKYGFLNKDFKVIVPPMYTSSFGFSEGFASVSKEKDKWGLINRQGEVIIPFSYTFISKFSHGRAWVLKDGKYGFIDTTGKVIVPLVYKNAGDFSDGLAMVNDGHYKFIDVYGNVKIHFPEQYDNFQTDFINGYIEGIVNSERIFILKNGKIIKPE